MDGITGPAEVHDHRYRAGRKSFGDHAWTVVAKGWKHKHVSRSEAAEDFRMADPPAERNSLLDPKGSCELLEAVPFRTVTDHGEAGQVASQKWSSRAQGEITSLPGNQAANENQLKFGAGLRPARVVATDGATDAGL